MDEIAVADPLTIENGNQEVDIFAWANNLMEFKGDLVFDIFLLNKNYIPYKTNIAKDLALQLEDIFVEDLLGYVFEGLDSGLTVRNFEEAEREENILQKTTLQKVDKARETFNWIRHQEHELSQFGGEPNDMKRIKAIIARVSHPQMKQNFFIVKHLSQSGIIRKDAGWMLSDGKFKSFEADAAIKIPTDNQLLVIDQDIFVFSQAKLKQIFDYDVKESSIAEQKVNEILAKFKLSFPEGSTMQDFVSGKKSLIKKLQKIDADRVTQEELLSHAEELEIELMEDDNGAIIIMETSDLDKFVNLLNDDYVQSTMTGERYEILRKRPIKYSNKDEIIEG